MTADHTIPGQPAHPLNALTTYELSGYRRDLEDALAALPALPAYAAARNQLQHRLRQVLAEQDSRAQIALGR